MTLPAGPLVADLRQVRVPDGTRLAYRRYGREGATRVVLCDGISCDGYIWRDLLPTLATNCDVLHLNYRGHGRSGLPRAPANCALPDLAADMDYVLGALGWATDATIPGPIFIGHSMGVQVALETAFRYPTRVGAMVLCCGSFGRVLDSFKHTDLGARLLPLFDAVTQTWRDSVSAAMRALLPSPLSYTLAALTEIKSEHIRPLDFQPYLDHFARMPMDLFMGLLGDAAERTSMPFLARVTQPTFVIAGQDDGFTPIASSKLLAATLPNAELLIVPHTSHTAPLEAPAIFEERIMGFITTLAAASPTSPAARRSGLAGVVNTLARASRATTPRGRAAVPRARACRA
jgi:pimeloyl-ACP methyl ester carboxylesterase